MERRKAESESEARTYYERTSLLVLACHLAHHLPVLCETGRARRRLAVSGTLACFGDLEGTFLIRCVSNYHFGRGRTQSTFK